MNTRTTLLVFLLAVLLGGYFLAFETDMFHMKTAGTKEAEQAAANQTEKVGQPLLAADALPADRIAAIELQAPDAKPVALELTLTPRRQWNQTRPVHFPATEWAARDLINLAAELRYTSTLTAEQAKSDAAALGLTPPRLVITYTTAASDTAGKPVHFVLKLGQRGAAGRAYVQINDDPRVYVVNDDLHQRLLDKPFSEIVRDMRQRTLLSVEPGTVRQVTLTREGKTLELAQRDGLWSLSQPVSGRADKDAAIKLIGVFGNAYVDRFVADLADVSDKSLAPFGLDHPQTILRIAVATAPVATQPASTQKAPAELPTVQHTLYLGGKEDLSGQKIFARFDNEPVIFTLAASAVQNLANASVDGLRDPRLTPVTRTDVRELTIRRAAPAAELHFVKHDAAWAFGDPKPAFALDAEMMNKLLDALFKTRAQSYVDLDAAKLAAPVATLQMKVLGKSEDEVLNIHRASADAKTATIVRGSERVGLVVPAEALEPLFADALHFRDRTVLALKPDEPTWIRICRGGAYPLDQPIGRNYPPTQPAATQPQTKPLPWKLEGLEAEAVEHLLAQFTPLHAVEWIASPKPHVAADAVIVSLNGPKGHVHNVLFFPDNEAAVAGQKEFFRADPKLVTLLQSELRERTVLKLELDQIASVAAGAQTVTRDPEGMYELAGPGQLDEAAAGAMFDALAGLRVEHFVPAPVPAPAPIRTLTIRTSAGRQETLDLLDAKLHLARLGDKCFTLSKTTFDKLAAKLTKEPAK